MVKITETTYNCEICKHTSKQISHHQTHLSTQKHIQNREILKLKLEKIPSEKIVEKFKKDNIDEILDELQNQKIVIEKKESPKPRKKKESPKTFEKKKKTNTLIYQKEITEIKKKNEGENFKSEFISFVGKMHNLLRGSAVTGDDALDDILHILFLSSINEKFTEEFSHKKIMELCHSEILEHSDLLGDEEETKKHINCLDINFLIKHDGELRIKNNKSKNNIEKCATILSFHPLTKNLFRDKDFINCLDIGILKTLLKECHQFSKEKKIFEQIDVIGLAYEYMSTKHGGNTGTSKEMGQYFTERPLMEMCFQLIDKKDIEDLGINEKSTLGDEFCATFGFPIMAKKFLEDNIGIKIKDENIYGVEYHERLSRFAQMNAMFSMNNFKNVKRGDSFITNVSPHLDISVHNVPFGKSMTPSIISKKYKDLCEEDKSLPVISKYLPFCDKKIDAILASQVVLYKTRKMGLMIIKDGEETSGKSNEKYRKWFSEKCIIKKIMKIPSGAFTCTGTKTVCIYFIKKEGQMTENIQFLQLSDDGNKITEICKVSTEYMKQNHHSWDPNSYTIDEEMEKMMGKSKCEWKKLGDLFELKNGNFNSNQMDNEGEFPFYSCISNNPAGLCSKYNMDYENYLLLVSAGGSQKNLCGDNVGLGKCYIVSGKTACRTNVYALIQKEKINNIKYTYFYLDIFRNVTNSKAKFTTNLGVIGKDDINNLNIPIPNFEVQNQVVQILDDLAEQKQLLSDRKSGIERQMKYYFETQIKKHINNITFEPLENITDMSIKGDTNSKDASNTGEYPFYKASVSNPQGTHKTYCFDGLEYILFVKSGGNAKNPLSLSHGIGKCYLVNDKSSGNSEVMRIVNNNTKYDYLTTKYLYYYLKFNQLNIQKLAKYSTNLGHIDIGKLKKFNIVIFKEEKQTEIVQYLDKLESKNNNIDEEINDIDNLMKQVLEQSYM